jgi:hypothetical protein
MAPSPPGPSLPTCSRSAMRGRRDLAGVAESKYPTYMAIPERKILFPKVRPSIPVKRIREAVRKVIESDRQEEAPGTPIPPSKPRRIDTRPA